VGWGEAQTWVAWGEGLTWEGPETWALQAWLWSQGAALKNKKRGPKKRIPRSQEDGRGEEEEEEGEGEEGEGDGEEGGEAEGEGGGNGMGQGTTGTRGSLLRPGGQKSSVLLFVLPVSIVS